jgi:hypothetical protein
MPMSTVMPSFGALSRTTSGPQSTNTYQTTRMDASMPMFPSAPTGTTVPYQSGIYAFDNMAVNPYNIQQTYGVSYQPQTTTYTAPGITAGLPHVREARNTLSVTHNASPIVKPENESPVQQTQVFSTLETGEQQHATGDSENNINFSTDVDVLMKAIQAKSKPQRQTAVTVAPQVTTPLLFHVSDWG